MHLSYKINNVVYGIEHNPRFKMKVLHLNRLSEYHDDLEEWN